MYTEETIQLVKEKAEIVEVVSSFVAIKKDGASYTACCPFHKEKTPSFKVSHSKQIYKCFGCGASGDAVQWLIDYDKKTYTQAIEWLANKYHINLDTIDNKPKVYALPVWKNKTTISKYIVQWFEARLISQKTLIDLRITDGVEWMPQTQCDRKVIEFNYFRNNILENIKYRTSDKQFKLFKNAQLILYNIDAIKDCDECYITEGCIDTLSLHEAGIKNVVSVPNGASRDTNNLQYIDNCYEEIKHIKKFHLAFDNDLNGRKLREDISERLGKDKCDYIEFLDCKDGNECLMRYGIQGVIDSCGNKIEFPLEGVFTISDISNEIDDMYINGLEKGLDIDLPGFDCRLVKGYIYTWTGIPSHGKTSLVDEVTMRSLIKGNWRGAFYSPENKPTRLHFSKLARKLIGKHWDGPHRMTNEEKDLAKNFLESKVWFVKPKKGFSLQNILEAIKELKVKRGLDYFVIDAWNKLEHKGDGSTDYVGKMLDELAIFCEENNLLCHLVVHPTKIEKDKRTGKYNVPTMYNCSGSSHFYNKSDCGFSGYRDFDTNETTLYRQKIKFDHWGTFGYSIYKYDVVSTRYYVEGCQDTTNWITKETNSVSTNNVDIYAETKEDYDF